MLPTKDDKNLSWRQRDITIPPGDLIDIDFPDTKPNHIYINNLSPNNLYAGVNTIPSKTVYELAVDAFGTDILAQQVGMTRCLLLNSGATPARIIVTSFDAPFNPATLSRKAVAGGGSTGGGGGAGGVITGFQVALPPGNNNIGRVVVTDMPVQTFTMDTLPSGNNKIGTVDVNKLPALAAGVSHIGSVGIDGGVSITSMPPVSLNGNVTLSDTSFAIKGESKYYAHEGTVSTTEIVLTLPYELTSIKYITNDGTTDLLVAFNSSVTTSSRSGLNAPIVLKPGEVIDDLNILATVIKLRRPSGSGAVRIVGV